MRTCMRRLILCEAAAAIRRTVVFALAMAPTPREDTTLCWLLVTAAFAARYATAWSAICTNIRTGSRFLKKSVAGSFVINTAP